MMSSLLELVIEQEKPFYKISFSYPDEQKIKASKAEIKKKELENKQNLKKELEKTRVPKNWDFIAHVNKNSDDIAPDFAYDDGVFTYLGFWHTKTIPSVFNFDENDEESLLNTHIKKDGNYDVVVVHKLSKRILLRSGQKLVGVFNKGYGKNPLKQPQNTISNKVEREFKTEQYGTPHVGIWAEVIKKACEGKDNSAPERPDNIIPVQICKDSGLLVAEGLCDHDERGNRTFNLNFI